MARSLLPLAATLLLSFTVLSASAADAHHSSASTSSDVRVEVDAQREHLTGANTVKTQGTAGAQTVLDAPVDTADAPSGSAKK